MAYNPYELAGIGMVGSPFVANTPGVDYNSGALANARADGTPGNPAPGYNNPYGGWNQSLRPVWGQDWWARPNGNMQQPSGVERNRMGGGPITPGPAYDPTITTGPAGPSVPSAPGPGAPQVLPGVQNNPGQSGVQLTGNGLPTPYGGSLYDLGMQGLAYGVQPFQTDFLNNLSNSLYSQANQNYMENLKPTLDSQAMMAGGYGGDRAALAQGVVMSNIDKNVSNAMAPIYNQAYEGWLNRGVNTGQAALGADVQYGNLGLGQYNAESLRNYQQGQLTNQNFDSQLKGWLGMGSLDIDAYRAQNEALTNAAAANGGTVYTNPWSSGIGAGLGLWKILNG